jgi:outer membrane lipoprotein SlyB
LAKVSSIAFHGGFANEEIMKTSSLLTLVSATALLAACTTEIGPNGQPRQVMTPLGAAAVQGLSAAAIGAGTGALMRGVNPVAAGAISAGAGSIGSQAINAFIPKSSGQGYQQQPTNQQLYVRSGDGFAPAKINYVQQGDGSYVPSYPRGRQLFRQLPNGSFAPVN